VERPCKQEEAGQQVSFVVKGEAIKGASGVNRQSEEGKLDYTLLRDGPMFKRWAGLLTRAIPKRGRRNWMLAGSTAETAEEDMDRFKRGASRHFEQWLDGETDEDHAAALFFNVNGYEYVKARIDNQDFKVDPFYALAREIIEESNKKPEPILPNSNNVEMPDEFAGWEPQAEDARKVTTYKVRRKVLGQDGIKDVCCGDPSDCRQCGED
jgi:hypothetical protein